MRNTKYEQPWFSANNFTFTSLISPSGGDVVLVRNASVCVCEPSDSKAMHIIARNADRSADLQHVHWNDCQLAF